MKIDFTGKSTLIVGGSSGIGEGIKKKFLELGSDVISISKSEGVDITNLVEIDNFYENITNIDFLINVAAINSTNKIEDISFQEWENVISTNLSSFFYIIKKSLEFMNEGSRIVNFSSIAGRNRSLVSGLHYTSSKAGIIGLTRQLAYELGPRNINVNCVCPSQTKTKMLLESMTLEDQNNLSEEIPLKRLATVSDQVGPVVFLCSELANYINGAIIDVNGGQL